MILDITEIAALLAAEGLLAGEGGMTMPGLPICGVSADSRNIRPGMIFCAISGSRIDGRDFIPLAAASGASAVIAAGEAVSSPVPVIRVKDDYLAFSSLVRLFSGCPDNDLALTAVTGTNGKTTSVYALRALDEDPAECGIMTTVTVGCGNEFHEASHTTPDAEAFFTALHQMRSRGCRRVYFEASSHALHQSRMGNIKLQSAVFTNLTQDHLDYHGTMEEYYQAKKRLFTRYLAEGGKAVINTDDDAGMRLKCELMKEYPGRFRIFDFGTAGASHPLHILPAEGRGCRFSLDSRIFRSNLTGSYNVFNLAGAILASPREDIPGEIDVHVPGRLESFVRADGARVFVDFAHTDDALTRVLTELRKITAGKVIVVFGAGGDRDKGKRPKMGRAAALGADTAYITSDNPRSEDPEAIIADIASGMGEGRCTVHTCCDRSEAIRMACREAGKDDIVLIAGKGHENTQEINGVKTHFSDAEEAEKQGFYP